MCNFSRMIKNVLPCLRQRADPQKICSRQKSIRSGTARDSFSQAPHMRGKVIVDLVLTERHRITPAYAGKSRQGRSAPDCPRDHPRTCGEKLSNPPMNCSAMGSPPHMRGKDHRLFVNHRFLRITPAHAGKSPAMSPGHITLRDHPRTCGEKGISDFSGNYEDGSPPHMRGKARSPLLFPGISRITPAHAGKSKSCSMPVQAMQDHPRTCGEKQAQSRDSKPEIGSPPHMRGKD